MTEYLVKYESRYWEIVGSEYLHSSSTNEITEVFKKAEVNAKIMGWRVHSIHEVP